MKVAISQPRYLPAVNYLQRMHLSDLFLFLDNVQRQSRGWENRNKILMNGSETWITIPIASSSREIIKNTRIAGADWIEEHKNIIRRAYEKHPYYDEAFLEGYYAGLEHVMDESRGGFAETLIHILKNACGMFGFEPRTERSSGWPLTDGITGPDKLLLLCRQVPTTIYVSGPNGREYGVAEVFAGSGIGLRYHEFSYPEYAQYGSAGFVPWLSFFDVLFNIGLENTKKIITAEPQLKEL